MEDVLSLALPFFGLIFLGYFSGKFIKIPAEGLAWLNFFVIYLALPALFFQLLSRTPIEEMANLSYVASTTFASYCAFAIAFCIGVVVTRGRIPEATIQGLIGAYSNIGYMGPGLTLAALGPIATVPTALIFCFDNILFFTLAPLMMAIDGTESHGFGRTALMVLKRIITHPFIIATIAGVAAAALHVQPPKAIDQILTYLRSAAAPCALFALGITVSMSKVRSVPIELPAILAVKLVVHPLMVFLLLSWVGGIDPVWIATAVLMACLPPAANVYVIAQQYKTYVERASSAVLIGTIASVVTVTAILYLIKSGQLPVVSFGGPS